MKRPHHRKAAIAGLITVIILALALAAPFLVPERAYLDWAIRRIEARYPVRVRVESASLRLLPSPSLTLNGLRVSIIDGADTPESPPFVESPETAVISAWGPLLSKEIRFRLACRSPVIRVIETGEGVYNYERLLNGASDDPHDPPVKTSLASLFAKAAHAQEVPSEGSGGWTLNPQSIEAADARLIIQKLKLAPQTYAGLNLALNEIRREGSLYRLNARVSTPLPQLKLPEVGLEGPLSYDTQGKRLSTVSPLNLTGGGLQGMVQGSASFAESAQTDLEAQLESIDLDVIARNLPEGSAIRSVKGHVGGRVHAGGPLESLKGTVDLKSDDFSLSIPPSVEIKKQPLSIAASLSRRESGWEVSEGRVTLGPQAVRITRASFDSGGVSFAADAGRLDLNYLAGVMPALKSLPPAKNVSLTVEGNLTREGDGFPVSGTVEADEIVLGERAYTGARADFRYRSPTLQLDSVRANGMGGRFLGSARIDFAQDGPQYHFDLRALDLSAEEVSGLKGLIAGRGSLDIRASGKLGEAKARSWSQTMNGGGNADFSQLTVPALRLFDRIFSNSVWEILIPLTGAVSVEKLRELKGWDRKAQFLKSAFSIRNGAVEVREVRLEFPQASLLMAGSVGLDKSLNFSGNLNLRKELLAGFIGNPKLLQALINSEGILAVPLKLTGFAHAPIFQPDTAELQSKLAAFVRANGLEGLVRGTKAEQVLDEIRKNLPVRIEKTP